MSGRMQPINKYCLDKLSPFTAGDPSQTVGRLDKVNCGFLDRVDQCTILWFKKMVESDLNKEKYGLILKAY